MALTPEDRLARALVKGFDSLSLNTRLAARFTIHAMTYSVQSKFFDFILYCIVEFHDQDTDQPYRNEIINVIYDALARNGYTAYTHKDE